MAVILALEFFEKLPLYVVVVLVDFVKGFLSIFFDDLGVFLETEIRRELAVLE